MCVRGLLQSTLLLVFGMAASWAQAISSCELTMDPGGYFDSPQAALNAASAYALRDYEEPSDLQMCKGTWRNLHWVLDLPVGRYWPFIGMGVRGFCEIGLDGKAHLVSTKNEIYSVYVAARCSGGASSFVTLTGPIETRPTGTGGSSEITVTAKVADGGTPKSAVAVSFSVEVIPNSGGHDHHDVNRPKGSLSAIQGTTDANGEVKVTFKAPEVAGIHIIKATCSICSNNTVTKEIQVKVADLLPISPNPPRNDDGTYVYALTSVDKIHEGNGRYHRGQYWLIQSALTNLQELIQSFAKQGWGTVALNDASMFWGGRYDINGDWRGPHQGHREGREIDISFTRASNPVPASKQKVFYKKFCEDKGVEAPFSILHHFVKVPHFHVYLDKQKTCARSEN